MVAKGNMLKGWKGKRTMGKFRWFLSHLHERDFASFTLEFEWELFFTQTAAQLKNSLKSKKKMFRPVRQTKTLRQAKKVFVVLILTARLLVLIENNQKWYCIGSIIHISKAVVNQWRLNMKYFLQTALTYFPKSAIFWLVWVEIYGLVALWLPSCLEKFGSARSPQSQPALHCWQM